MIIELIPLIGIIIDKIKIIELGTNKDDVIKILGKPDNIDNNSLFYFKIGLKIELDKNMKVVFLECFNDNEEDIEVRLYNVNPFKTEDETLLKILEEKNKGQIEHERQYNYYFLNLSLGIGRELSTSDALDMIKQAKDENIYEEMQEQLESDLKKSKYFDSIGIGIKNCYQIN